MLDLSSAILPDVPPSSPARTKPPRARQSLELPSAAAARSPITHLRHVALAVPDLRAALAFYQGIWGLYRTAGDSDVAFLGSVGIAEPFVIRLRQSSVKRLDLIAFGARNAIDVDLLAERLGATGIQLVRSPGKLDTPGGGYGFRFFDPDGRLTEVSSDVAPKGYRDLEIGESIPRKLSHVVVNAPNIETTKAFYEDYLGFRLSDWLTDRMCFLRCSSDHHSLAIAQRPASSLNHVSFEMRGIDEYMRGTGRLVRHGHRPLWGPGRHSAGDNTYSYFNDPHGNVVEYTTELEQITDEDAWTPRIWPATSEYSDQWGTAGSGEDLYALKSASEPDAGLWVPAPV
jgi:catechol 2,3-dioxygenase-like lactoylglutathione lyase family enzyme